MKIYLVGGAVRDKLLGIPVKDHDWVVVGSSPDEMKKKGFKQVGKDFPVCIDPKTGEETLAVRHGNVIGLLIEAIKELQEKVGE